LHNFILQHKFILQLQQKSEFLCLCKGFGFEMNFLTCQSMWMVDDDAVLKQSFALFVY